jgi:hypothetical protein
MQFVLKGETYDIDPAVARHRIKQTVPEAIQTHWVEIDGERWPVMQAFEVATGIPRRNYISHRALDLLRRLGFTTSERPTPGPAVQVDRRGETVRSPITTEEAQSAFATLDGFLQSVSLTQTIKELEHALDQAGPEEAADLATRTGLGHEVVTAALIVRERVGMLDSLIHAAVITQTVPLILEPDERLVRRPSLAAGNDRDRVFDLETTIRVAEFKVAQWKGADSLRQRGLVADLVGLANDQTGRRRQLYLVGSLPAHFLRTSGRKVAALLSKSALRLRDSTPVTPNMTVADLTAESGVEIIDLARWFPQLAGVRK